VQAVRIAVINETSAANRNIDIVAALADRGLEVINCGMKKNGEPPELTYIHTGFLSALLLNLGCVDFVIGGCGTGQGFLNSVLQYPNVICGHIASPLDAWLFHRINGGNCVSLALNQGYGWGSEVNVRLIFDELFSSQRGEGFPAHRKESQQQSAELLRRISRATHLGMEDTVRGLPPEVVMPALTFPGIREIIESAPSESSDLMMAVRSRLSPEPEIRRGER
jgi:ribose 5-phosphate isomerase RpiB